jgi:aryl-alcohol dehydrogenase-like predicted oxidoreductase
MQNLYNLIYREEEREMIPYCVDADIAGIPYSPLAMGELTGKDRKTARSDSGSLLTNLLPDIQQESNQIIIDRIEELAKKHSKTNAQIAMAWLYTKKYITSPIVGFSKIEQLYDIMGSFDIKLSEEETKYLDEPYTPRPVSRYG